MSQVCLDVLVSILKAMSVVYDILTYIPWRIITQPEQKLQRSGRIKAIVVSETPAITYRSIDSLDHLSTNLWEDCLSVNDMFTRAVRLYRNCHCLGFRSLLSEEDERQSTGKIFRKWIQGDYEWLTYGMVDQRVTNLGRGMLSLSLRPRQRVCIYAETRAEWMISALMCLRFNFPLITLYSTLGEEAIVQALNETEVTHMLTSADLLPKLAAVIDRVKTLGCIVYMSSNKTLVLTNDFPQNINIHSIAQVESRGKPSGEISSPQPDDIAVIMYTSGSTGAPKGVLISHRNIVCAMSGLCQKVPGIGPQDTYISYLPLAHVLGLTAELSCIVHGCRVGYSSPLTLSDQSGKIKRGTKGDVSVLKPTLMAAVPVIMDRIYKAVWEKVLEGGIVSKALFKFCYNYKNFHYERGCSTPLCDSLVFKKTSAILGGRVRMLLSGGAPLSADTERFMNICLCCPVGQGYGLTETCGAGTIKEHQDLSTGRVGAPLWCNDIMLKDWVEGGYQASDTPLPRGEIVIGGGNVTMGYFKNADKSAEDYKVFNGKRWFYTGDIGEFHPDGSLRIIDRKKDLVKLQTGEYISPGKVENGLKLCPLVDQICIFANSNEIYVVALVVPNSKQLRLLAASMDLDQSVPSNADIARLCENKNIESNVLTAVQDQGKLSGLEKFEIPQKLKLCPDPWTPDSGLVTDAFKLKRKSIEERFKIYINEMYS